MVNKDFLRQIFAEEKSLLKLSEVKWVTAPRFDELSVTNLYPKMQADAAFMRYMPDRLPKGRLPEREYFFNVLSTLHPKYTRTLISNASNHRHDAEKNRDELGVVKASQDLWDRLTAVPFKSRKYY